MTPRRIAALVVVAALVMVASASTADTFQVTLVSQNSTTITLGWTPQPGYGYLFSADGNLVSRTNDPSRSTVKFSKSFSSYEVAVIVKGATGTYPTAPPPPPPAQCADGIDNDGDGLVDLADPGCTGTTDNDETNAPPPPPTGFPDASNTGVPSGTTLTAYTGPSNVTTANTVIDGKSIGCITVSASNVVIRNSRISCGGSTYYAVQVQDSSASVTVSDSEIDCKSRNANGAGRMNITLLRVEITDCENGLSVAHDVTVQDSFIHQLFHGNGAHADGMQFEKAAGNVDILHSTILGVGQQGEDTDAAFIADLAGHHDWLVENNLFGGGGYTIYCVLGKGTNWIIRNNAFTLQYGRDGTSGKYGFSTECGDETQSGNYVLETGQQIVLR